MPDFSPSQVPTLDLGSSQLAAMPGRIPTKINTVCMQYLLEGGAKNVTGLVPVGANPDFPSDFIVASWIKGGERAA